MGAGDWAEAVTSSSDHVGVEKMRPAFDSAVPLWQGARRFAGNFTVAPRDYYLSIKKD
jgi:hypothetical protein